MENYRSLDLAEVWKIIKEKIKIIIPIISIFLIMGIIYAFVIVKPIYKTKAEIIIDKAMDQIGEQLPDEDIIKEVAEEMSINYKEVKDSIKTAYSKYPRTIDIYVNTNDALKSYDIANRYIEKLQTKLNRAFDVEKFELLKKPEIAQKPCNINPVKDITVSLAIGLLISFAYVIIIYKIKTQEEK